MAECDVAWTIKVLVRPLQKNQGLRNPYFYLLYDTTVVSENCSIWHDKVRKASAKLAGITSLSRAMTLLESRTAIHLSARRLTTKLLK